MRPYKERLAEAQQIYQQGLTRVRTTPAPAGQKFPPGTFVDIAEDLGPYMRHFSSGVPAKVEYTYAHAYGGGEMDAKQYSLLVRTGDGHWTGVSWYDECQLTEITDPARLQIYRDEIIRQSEKE